MSTNGFYFQLCFCPKPYVISGRSFTLRGFHANKARRLDQLISKALSGSKPLWSVHGCSSPAVLLSTQTVFYLYPSCVWSWDHWVWWSLRSSKSSMACVFRSQHSNQATETRWSFLVHLTSIKELNALPSSNCRRKKFFFDKWYKFDLESLNRFLSYSLLVLEVLWWPQISFVILLALLHCYYVAPGSWSWWYEDWLPSGTWWHHALIW